MIASSEPILAFEYFTASGEKDQCIISEAEALIFSLLDDLKDEEVHLVINETYKDLVNDYENVSPILINEPLENWLLENAAQFKRAIFIAAENDNNLYKFTKILEDNNVKLYTSSAEACYVTSDKYELFEELYGVVPQPRTFKFKIDPKGYWKRALINLYKKWQAEDPLTQLKIIIKPVTCVDCENIKIIEDINDLSYDLEKIFPPGSRILVQEYIEGIDVSVSLICDGENVIPICLNKQFIEIRNEKGTYIGGQSPFKSEFEKEAFDTAVKAVKSVDGLKGFVGVDLRISDDGYFPVYLLEINSRFTTPYVGIQKITNFNIASAIIKLIDGEIAIEDIEKDISLEGSVVFKKRGNNLIIDVDKE